MAGCPGEGPDFPGAWDGERGLGPERVLAYCHRVLTGTPAPLRAPAPEVRQLVPAAVGSGNEERDQAEAGNDDRVLDKFASAVQGSFSF